MKSADLDSIQAALLEQLEEETWRTISGWFPDDNADAHARRCSEKERWKSFIDGTRMA